MESTQKFKVKELTQNIQDVGEPTDAFATQVLSKNSDDEGNTTLTSLNEIANERYFLMKGRIDLAFATRHKTDIAVMVMQVDKFEMIKAGYDAKMIDGMLSKLGKYIKSELRIEDTVARMGDDMFGVLLVSADPLGALEVAERVRQKVKRKTICHGEDKLSVTVSVGVSAPSVNEERSFEKMLHEAKHELGKAVSAGGDYLMADAVRRRVIQEDSIAKKALSLDDALTKVKNYQEHQLDENIHEVFSTLLPLLKYCDRKLALGITSLLEQQSTKH